MKVRLLKSETTVALITIVLLTTLTHGLRISDLGYYRDDWYLIWNGFTQGYESISSIFLGDRPFMGIIYSWTYRFLGNEPLNWHIYALFLKLGGVLTFFWLLRMIWPESYFATTAATCLFIVYPGFLQQPNANTFQNHLLGYFLGLLSVAFTIRGIKSNGRGEKFLFYGSSVLLQIIYLNIYEYMIGLEGVRLLLIWFVTRREEKGSSRAYFLTMMKRWVLYAPAVIGVVYWRVFVFESTRQAMNIGTLLAGYSGSRLRSLIYLFFDTAIDIFEAIVSAWFVPLYGFLRVETYRNLGISVLYSLIAVGIVFLYYLYLKKRSLLGQGEETKNQSKKWLWIGLIITIFTIVPVVLAGRNIYFNNQFDRYTLQATIGISIFIAGLIFFGLRAQLRIFLLAALVFIGVNTHFHNISYHEEFWQSQRELWWQLSWRAPDIADDTVLVATLPSGYRLAESYEIWGPANIIYRPESESLEIPAEILNRDTAQEIIRNTSDDREQRGAEIVRDYDNVLIISKPSTLSCVHVIDGAGYALSPEENLVVEKVAPYSKIDRIDTEAIPHIPPSSIFDYEPDHTWCFFYQKMSLSRQRGDWEEVVRLADEALDSGYKPLDISEWMPVYEGYANIGRKKEARNISRILRSDKNLQHEICTQLEEWSDIPDDYDHSFIYGELCLTK